MYIYIYRYRCNVFPILQHFWWLHSISIFPSYRFHLWFLLANKKPPIFSTPAPQGGAPSSNWWCPTGAPGNDLQSWVASPRLATTCATFERRWSLGGGRWGCGVRPWGVLKSWGSPIAGGFYHGKYWNILFKWMNIMVVSILKWSNDDDNWPYADQIVTTEWLGKSPS